MLDMEVTNLNWPSFCYNREQVKSVKRKWEEVEEFRGESPSPDQSVPQLENHKKHRPDFPFSSLMRNMAAKYHVKPNTPHHNPFMSIFSPMNNPYSRLMENMAKISQSKPKICSEPLDLSSVSSDKEIDVVNFEEEQEPLNQWNCHQVKRFIDKIDNCEEYSEVFFNEKIDGATLALLTVTHMVTFLGVRVEHAVEIVRRRGRGGEREFCKFTWE